MYKRSKCCIIGIPDHQAVVHLGGRIGAARGPRAFREQLSRLTGRISKDQIEDCGNIPSLSVDIAANHKNSIAFIKSSHSKTNLSIIIGGSHDHGYSHLHGIHQSLKTKTKRLGCINIDAHLDVRKPNPEITSGSPFYLAIENKIIEPQRFIEFGIQSHCNSMDLWEYVKKRKLKVVPWPALRFGNAVATFKKQLKALEKVSDAIVISFDLDSVASAYAPGVSAPQSEGLTPMEAIAMMEIAGASRKVVSLGIFELNPEHDIGDRTAKLAATAAFHFMESAFLASGSK